jgi:hypothetical protein
MTLAQHSRRLKDEYNLGSDGGGKLDSDVR